MTTCDCWTCRSKDEAITELEDEYGPFDPVLLKIDRVKKELEELTEEHTFHWEVTKPIQKAIDRVREFLCIMYEQHLEYLEERNVPMKFDHYDGKVKTESKKAKKILERLDKKGICFWKADLDTETEQTVLNQVREFAKEQHLFLGYHRVEVKNITPVEQEAVVLNDLYCVIDMGRNIEG